MCTIAPHPKRPDSKENIRGRMKRPSHAGRLTTLLSMMVSRFSRYTHLTQPRDADFQNFSSLQGKQVSVPFSNATKINKLASSGLLPQTPGFASNDTLCRHIVARVLPILAEPTTQLYYMSTFVHEFKCCWKNDSIRTLEYSGESGVHNCAAS